MNTNHIYIFFFKKPLKALNNLSAEKFITSRQTSAPYRNASIHTAHLTSFIYTPINGLTLCRNDQ